MTSAIEETSPAERPPVAANDAPWTPLTSNGDAEEFTPDAPNRLFTRRTILSIAVAALIVALAVWRAPINWGDAWAHIRGADIGLYFAALLAYYASFVVRAVRWEILLRNAGEDRRASSLFGIIISSYFVNCIVPAKMGDIYRAYLVRYRQRVGATKAFGTIIAERLIDLCVLMTLLIASGAFIFQSKHGNVIIPYVIAGIALCGIGIATVVVMHSGRGTRLLRLLPEAVFQRYERFRLGTVHALKRWPMLFTLTAIIWGLEATRLGFIVFSLGFGDLLGPSKFMLLALVAALLTTVPFLPGGVGLVETGMVVVLTAIGGIAQGPAVSITLLDRSVSYGSLVIIGFGFFMATHLHTPKHRVVAETPIT